MLFLDSDENSLIEIKSMIDSSSSASNSFNVGIISALVYVPCATIVAGSMARVLPSTVAID